MNYELDDADRALLTKCRKAMEYADRGDPVKDVMDEYELIDAVSLLIRTVEASEGSQNAHSSDCAQQNEPAYPNGPCDCGAIEALIADFADKVRNADAGDGGDSHDDVVNAQRKLFEAVTRGEAAPADVLDAARYRWLKMESKPGEPFELHKKLREAKQLVAAYEIFCTGWTGWDAAIDAARTFTGATQK